MVRTIQYRSAFLIAIENEYNELVEYFIRSGVNLDGRLHDEHHGAVLPFEYAVHMGNTSAAEMLLRAGCSCGELHLVNTISTDISSSERSHDYQWDVSSELQKLMIDLNVHENNVKLLHQLSRKSILNHLCPGAAKKITELPLPSRIIRYLCIPELVEEPVV